MSRKIHVPAQNADIERLQMEVITELEKIIPEFVWRRCDENWNCPFCILMNKQKEIIRTVVVVAYFDEPY